MSSAAGLLPEKPLHPTRRQWLLTAVGLGATAFAAQWLGARIGTTTPVTGLSGYGRNFDNFKVIYGDPKLRANFRDFLLNVFHLYPEVDFDSLIAEAVARDPRDPAVYRELELRLQEIAPFLGAVRYSLPALNKQKAEMARQTAELLGPGSSFTGYLELGSHGRYLDQLSEHVSVSGPIYTSSFQLPGHSPVDVVDRGQLSLAGRALPWTDYAPLSPRDIEPGSLDLITVYIGLHHTTDEQRAPYARSLHQALSKRGQLIIRDHDVKDATFRHLVGLAHDVFNVGTGETWETNQAERRNFYSLDSLVELLEENGFKAKPGRLLQAGDPTHNTLLCFTKA